MASTERQRKDYITTIRASSKAFMEAVDALRALNSQHTATDIANDLTEEDFEGVSFAGTDNSGLTKADILAVLTTLGNIETMLAAGNATNLYKVITGAM